MGFVWVIRLGRGLIMVVKRMGFCVSLGFKKTENDDKIR